YKDGKSAGHCTVRDVFNNISRYYWNEDKRLSKIEKCSSDGKTIMTERFVWTEKGNLRAHTLFCEKDLPVHSRVWHYDSRGNVLSECLYGRFMRDRGDLKLDSADMPSDDSTCDKITTNYTYSDAEEGFNLKTSECDPRGNFTYYEYVKNSNLLRA